MANLKIFVSSTCYDLDIVRGQLRTFISDFGYEPVMSDYNDVLFDYRTHTHESCVKEIQGVDMVILIIGSRFGGKALPKALESIDFKEINSFSKSTKLFEKTENISITQLEVLKAIEMELPIYTFIDSKVSHYHLFYEKNKHKKDFLEKVTFPSIEKIETAKYIFEFINFIRHRPKNNSIVEFSRLGDIEDYLVKQWASLFQRLLNETKDQTARTKGFDKISSQLADIKTALLTSIGDSHLKETAKGAIQFRALIGVIIQVSNVRDNTLMQSDGTFMELLMQCGVEEIATHPNDHGVPSEEYLICHDRTFYALLYGISEKSLQEDWENFKLLSEKAKKAIISALNEISNTTIYVYYYDIKFEDFDPQDFIDDNPPF